MGEKMSQVECENGSVGNMDEPDKKYSFLELIKKIGPGAVVCATIIGPGTITTCTLAGVNYQYALIWAAAFATLAAIILQIISARVGIASGRSLGEVVYDTYNGSWMKYMFAVIIFITIGFGNSAFQSGNMVGAVLGLQAITPMPAWVGALIIAAITFALLWTGKTAAIEKIMTVMVFIMVILFVITAVVVKPDLGKAFGGFVPSIPSGAILVTIGVVGTTVIPHLLFLHSSLTSQKWAHRNVRNALVESNFDTILSMLLCGLITICVIVTGASMFGTGTSIGNGLDMAKQLEPLVGSWAKYVFGLGLFAAGITSSLSAPMSAAYALCSVMRWSTDMKDRKFVTATGNSPVQVILMAQAFNGIMLPISAVILMMMANNRKALGKYKNNLVWNILGIFVIMVTLVLGFRTLYNVIPSLLG